MRPIEEAEHPPHGPVISADVPGQSLTKTMQQQSISLFERERITTACVDLRGRFFLTIHVIKEFWEIEELWDELFDVGRTLHARLPGCCHRVELAVRAVEPAARRVSF